MTTIILIIIGILLAAVSAVMVVYYGGAAFGRGELKAHAATVISGLEQVDHARTLYQVQEGEVFKDDYFDFRKLVERKYLKSLPSSPPGVSAIAMVDNGPDSPVYASVDDVRLCKAINDSMGVSTILPTDGDRFSSGISCMSYNDGETDVYLAVLSRRKDKS